MVTLPKVVSPEQVSTLAALLELLERQNKLPPRSLAIELMVETTASIVDARGQLALPGLVGAAGGRCSRVVFLGARTQIFMSAPSASSSGHGPTAAAPSPPPVKIEKARPSEIPPMRN